MTNSQFVLVSPHSPQLILFRRQMVENLKKMQELKAQIQAQMKLAETLKKLSDNAGTKCSIHLSVTGAMDHGALPVNTE